MIIFQHYFLRGQLLYRRFLDVYKLKKEIIKYILHSKISFDEFSDS